MKVNQAEIVISAVSEKQYPGENYPEFALAGRSNVGKSSLINKLISRKNLARTSSKPGKTQTLNFYLINESLYFVDVPGYGYAQVSKQERAKWGGMMEEYFKNREPLRAVILITDLRHEPTDDDVQMYDYLKFFELPVIVIGTKKDKIPKTKQDKHIKRSKKILEMAAEDIFIPFSAETGEGKDDVWSAIKSFI